MSGTPADLSGFQVQVEHVFPAPPDAVWAVVSDLPGMAVHSPEVVTLTWDDPDQRRFTATNSRGGHTWTVPGHVVERAGPHLLRWTVLDPAHPSSTWAYALRPQDEGGEGVGTVVTHTFAHGPGPSLVRHQVEQDPARTTEVLAWRTAMLREDMASSLRRACALLA